MGKISIEEAKQKIISTEVKPYMNCLIITHGAVQSLKSSSHKSFGVLPSNKLSKQKKVEALFFTDFEVQAQNKVMIGVIPNQKKDVFLGSKLKSGPGVHCEGCLNK